MNLKLEKSYPWNFPGEPKEDGDIQVPTNVKTAKSEPEKPKSKSAYSSGIFAMFVSVFCNIVAIYYVCYRII